MLVDGLFMVELVAVTVGRRLWGSLLVVSVLVILGLMSVAVLRWRMYCKMLGVGLQIRKSTRLNSSHLKLSRMPSSA